MNYQNKWNRELLYSFIFFVTSRIWFFWNPFSEMRDILELSTNSLGIKNQLNNLGLYPIFYNVTIIMSIGAIFFLLCSIYAGILSFKKIPTNSNMKILKYIPQKTPGWLVTILIIFSFFYIVVHTILIFER